MKHSKVTIFIIQFIMFILILTNFLISNVLSEYIYVLVLGLLLLLLINQNGIDLNKKKNEEKILKNILILILSYFIIIYLSGLFIGFNSTIYSLFKLSNWIYNIIPTMLIIIISELIRYIMIDKSNYDKRIIVISFFIMTLLTLSISFKIYNLNELNQLYEFFGIILLGNIAKNIYLTFQCKNFGFKTNILYRLIFELYIFIVPFVPAFGPYINSIINIFLPVISIFVVFQVLGKSIIRRPKEINKRNITTTIIMIIMIIIVILNSGLIKYQTLTIGSESMKPTLNKGDVIILEKKNKEEKRKIKKGEILVFKYDDKIISHRVKKVIKRGEKSYFRTKGDNNETEDGAIIEEEKVLGVTKIRIRYIGLPSVWLQEMLR